MVLPVLSVSDVDLTLPVLILYPTQYYEHQTSENANAFAPALQSWVEVNLIREGIGLAGGNGGYMLLVPIDDGHNLHSRFL